MDNKLPNFD